VDGWPSFSADGRTIYFESKRGGRVQIYVAERPAIGVPFGTPILVPTIDDGFSNDGDPYLSLDGRTLLFASDRSGGAGGFDIYVSTRTN
jgi:Tol biopolymer transport system component